MDQPDASAPAELQETVWKESVDLKRRNRLLCLGPLLHDADGVDDRVRAESLNHPAHPVETSDVDPRDRVAFREQPEPAIGFQLVAESDLNLVTTAPGREELMPQHSVAAKNQDPHAPPPARSLIQPSSWSI